MIIDSYSLSILAFIVLLAVIIYRDRKNIKISNYVLITRRSRKGIEILDKMGKYKKFWKVVGFIGILTAFYLMIVGVSSLFEVSKKIITSEITGPTGGIILPSPTKSTIFGPGFIGIPFWIWIFILPLIMIPHELLHGIMSRVEKVRVKSFGFLLFLILPGAFVEPDDEKIKRLKLVNKLRIFVAGSFANFLVAMLLFNPLLNIGLIPNVVWPSFVSNGGYIVDVNKTSPAFLAGVPVNAILTHINGEELKIGYTDFLAGTYLPKSLENKTNETMILTVNGTNYSVMPSHVTTDNKTTPYIGLSIKPIIKTNEELFVTFIFPFFNWLWLLSLGVSIVNILPIYPLDGGLVVQSIVKRFVKKMKYQNVILSLVTTITIALLIFAILGPYLIRLPQFF